MAKQSEATMEKRYSPALSIITVCRNIAPEIEDTCRSVVGQNFDDFEWIVIDGASTDGTREILEKYSDRMTTLVSEPDSGIYNAMNKGIRLSQGERLLFLNGGDCLVSKGILAEAFSRNLEADICYCNIYNLNPDDDTAILDEARPAERLSKSYFCFHTIFHQAAFIRRALFDRFGLYDENFRIVSDWEKWIEFFENGCSFAKLDMALSLFRMGGISKTQAKLLDREMKKVQSRKFTAGEMRQARLLRKREAYTTIWSFGRRGGFSVASIKEREGGGMRIYSFLHIPVLKIRRGYEGEAYRLLGIVPVWKTGKKREKPAIVKNPLRRIRTGE